MHLQTAPILVLIIFLSGCGTSRIEELEYEVDQLEMRLHYAQQNTEILRDRLSAVQASTSDLLQATSRFEHENWRDVVPDVKDAADSIEYEVIELEDAVNDVVTSLE